MPLSPRLAPAISAGANAWANALRRLVKRLLYMKHIGVDLTGILGDAWWDLL